MTQKYQEAYEHNREIRVYIVEGAPRWAASSMRIGKEICLGRVDISCGEGRDAANAALVFAQAYAEARNYPTWPCDEEHRIRFLRVDIVGKGSGNWLLGELEFFGNANIILELEENPMPLFYHLVQIIGKWLSVQRIGFLV